MRYYHQRTILAAEQTAAFCARLASDSASVAAFASSAVFLVDSRMLDIKIFMIRSSSSEKEKELRCIPIGRT